MRRLIYKSTICFLALEVSISTMMFSEKAMAYSSSQIESVTSDEEAQINSIRDKEIGQLKIVLGRRFAESRKPDILLRLAELYIEKYRFYFLKENQLYQQLLKQGVHVKKVEHQDSKKFLAAAHNACLSILRSKVHFGKMDQVYYFMGYNAEEMGNRKSAQDYFFKVVRQYPRSSFAPEAYRNLAEYAFDQKKFTEAARYYEQAAKYTQVPSYPRTLFKLSWSYFKLRRKSDALRTMRQVIELTKKEDKFLNLREEALGDLAMFYSEAGKFSEATTFFKEVTGNVEYYLKALSRLSATYENRGEYRLAEQINDGIISEYGNEKPELIYLSLMKNVDLQKKMGNAAGEEKASARMVNYFVKHHDEIVRTKDGEESYLRVKSNIRDRAAEIHKLAQKKNDSHLYSRAADMYGMYMNSFLKDPSGSKERDELSEILFYKADCLLLAKRENEALSDLETSLRLDGPEKYRREAGATLLNRLIEKIDHNLKTNGKISANDEERFVAAARVFEDAYPKDKLVTEIRYKRARLAASKSGPEGLSKEARNALSELVEKFPSRKEAADSARELVADLLKRNKREDASELAGLYLKNQELLKTGSDLNLKGYFESVISRSSFEEVKDLEADKNYLKAAVEYEKLAERSKSNGEVYTTSLNNAAVNYDKAGKKSDALRIYSELAAGKPSKFSQMAKAELKRLALSHLWKGNYKESISSFQNLSQQNFFTSEERLGFAKTAFIVGWGNGKLPEAFSIANVALKSVCIQHQSNECHDLYLDSADLLFEAGRYEDMIVHLKGYLSHSGAKIAEANFKLARAYTQLHEDVKANQYYENAAKSFSPKGKNKDKDPSERAYAARSAFQLSESEYRRFSAIKLELPEEKMKRLTKDKISALEKLVSRYQAVVSIGDGEWGLAALERIYDAFYSFAEDLEKTPIPPRITDANSREQYKRGIHQVSGPMRQRGLENLNVGYRTGLNLDVTTPTFVALTQRLSLLSKEQYPPAHFSLDASEFSLLGSVSTDSADDRDRLTKKLEANSNNAEAWVSLGNLEAELKHYKLAKLFYEQALQINSGLVSAINNLSCLHDLLDEPQLATKGFEKAIRLAEFSKPVRLNHARHLLYYHHFQKAEETLRALVSRNPEDQALVEAYAVALLGLGKVSEAHKRMEALDASKKRFNLWYNWSVANLMSGDRKKAEKAYSFLNDQKGNLKGVEKQQVDIALTVFKGVGNAN